jgi:Flp pilus assembly protein TadG
MNEKLYKMERERLYEPSMVERGQSMVEIAFVLPLFLALIFSIIEVGRAWAAKQTLTISAREGARILTLPYGAGLTYATESDVQTAAIKAVEEMMKSTGVTVTAGTKIITVRIKPGDDGVFNTSDDQTEENYSGGVRGDRVGIRITHNFETPLPIILGMFNNGSNTDLPPQSGISMGVACYMDHE